MIVEPIDFAADWAQIQAAQIAPEENPRMWRGEYGGDISALLAQWRGHPEWANMPWRMWQEISSIYWADSPGAPDYLQLAEVFGTGGYLTLRRENGGWHWTFTGSRTATLPVGLAPCNDEDPLAGVRLRRYEDKAICWGKELVQPANPKAQGTGRWFDDRVAAADLRYPSHLSGIARVYLHYYRYTQAGRSVCIWLRGLGDKEKVKSWPF